MQFWSFSVLHCHGVFPSGDQQQQQQKCLQQQDEKVAKIHSSSKKKKQPKSSFSMGFRSYVRHFRGAILGLLRPSLPWCFPIRGPAAAAAAKAFIFIAFLWVSEVTLGCNFGTSPSFTAMVFSHPGTSSSSSSKIIAHIVVAPYGFTSSSLWSHSFPRGTVFVLSNCFAGLLHNITIHYITISPANGTATTTWPFFRGRRQGRQPLNIYIYICIYTWWFSILSEICRLPNICKSLVSPFPKALVISKG